MSQSDQTTLINSNTCVWRIFRNFSFTLIDHMVSGDDDIISHHHTSGEVIPLQTGRKDRKGAGSVRGSEPCSVLAAASSQDTSCQISARVSLVTVASCATNTITYVLLHLTRVFTWKRKKTSVCASIDKRKPQFPRTEAKSELLP